MRILIIKTSSLGDIIHSFPVIEYLKSRFPASMIDWVVEKPFADILESHPLISRVMTIHTKEWRKSPLKKINRADFFGFRRLLQEQEYDLVVDLQGNIKSGLIAFLSRSLTKVGFGWKSVPEKPNALFTNRRYDPVSGQNRRSDYLSLVQQYYGDVTRFISKGTVLRISPTDKEKIPELLSNPLLKEGPLVMVCLGSNWRNKQLKQETLADFLRLLRPHLDCHYLFVWGNEEEKNSADFLNRQFIEHSVVIDRLPLPILQNLMGSMQCVIAMDSLPLHLAGTIGTPTFGVFGPSLASTYNPAGNRHHAWQGSCPYGRTFTKRCPILRSCSTGACIRNADAEELFDSFTSKNY